MYGWQRKGGALKDHFRDKTSEDDVIAVLHQTRTALAPLGLQDPAEASSEDVGDVSEAARLMLPAPAIAERVEYEGWGDAKAAGVDAFQRGDFRGAAACFAAAVALLTDTEPPGQMQIAVGDEVEGDGEGAGEDEGEGEGEGEGSGLSAELSRVIADEGEGSGLFAELSRVLASAESSGSGTALENDDGTVGAGDDTSVSTPDAPAAPAAPAARVPAAAAAAAHAHAATAAAAAHAVPAAPAAPVSPAAAAAIASDLAALNSNLSSALLSAGQPRAALVAADACVAARADWPKAGAYTRSLSSST
jgi:hypothetical protein